MYEKQTSKILKIFHLSSIFCYPIESMNTFQAVETYKRTNQSYQKWRKEPKLCVLMRGFPTQFCCNIHSIFIFNWSTIECNRKGNVRALSFYLQRNSILRSKTFQKLLFKFSIWLIVTFENQKFRKRTLNNTDVKSLPIYTKMLWPSGTAVIFSCEYV